MCAVKVRDKLTRTRNRHSLKQLPATKLQAPIRGFRVEQVHVHGAVGHIDPVERAIERIVLAVSGEETVCLDGVEETARGEEVRLIHQQILANRLVMRAALSSLEIYDEVARRFVGSHVEMSGGLVSTNG